MLTSCMSTCTDDPWFVDREWSTPHAAERTLGELLEAIAVGDRTALATLYDRKGPAIQALVATLLDDRGRAEELTHDVFVEIWQRAGRFDASRGKASGWINELVFHRALDGRRTIESTGRRHSRYVWSNFVRDVDDVADEACAAVTRLEMRVALSRLPGPLLEAVTVTFLAGRTQAEASRYLVVPLGTLKSRVREALRLLRAAVTTDDPEPPRHRPSTATVHSNAERLTDGLR